MAKITCNYDTETKELSLMIDGINQPNPQSVSFYREDDEYGYFEGSFKKEENNGVIYRLSAYGSKVENNSFIEEYAKKVLVKNKK